jgi:NAD(P)-dependent dehydrogenase (short-subunit alcohol dehydrogenase family)
MVAPVVLITGALTGIGRATALAFAREGARLVISGRHDEEGKALAAELRGAGAEAEFVRADVRLEQDVRAMVDRTVERFGRLDVAVNNAGTEGKLRPIIEESSESYHTIFDTNVLGVLLSLKHELRVMMPQGNGSIVNLSSIVGHVGAANAAVYSASKHAVDGLTQAAALEAAGSGVRVNGVAPGPIETPMFRRLSSAGRAYFVDRVALKRAGTPEEVAQAVVFVASDKASFMTGTTVSVDGGQLAA